MIPFVPAGRRDANQAPRPDRRTAWREVAVLLGGELVEGKHPNQDKVVVAHGPWKIWLDTYTVSNGQTAVTYTRARAYFVGRRELRLSVRGVNFLDRLWRRLFGGGRAGLSRTLLENRVVRGKPEARLPSLFMASGLTDAVLAVKSTSLKVGPASRRLRKRYGESLGAVTCQTRGVLDNVNHMAAMVRLAAATLDALAGIGEARREEVGHS